MGAAGHYLKGIALPIPSQYKRSRLRNIVLRSRPICALCGDPECIDYSLPKSESHNSHYPTIDHIIPTSLGGTDDVSNLQAAGRRCNSVKQNGSLNGAAAIGKSDSQSPWNALDADIRKNPDHYHNSIGSIGGPIKRLMGFDQSDGDPVPWWARLPYNRDADNPRKAAQ